MNLLKNFSFQIIFLISFEPWNNFELQTLYQLEYKQKNFFLQLTYPQAAPEVSEEIEKIKEFVTTNEFCLRMLCQDGPVNNSLIFFKIVIWSESS